MSYILDALKKSEREKTLGQVPTLETVISDGAKKQPTGTPWWLNLLVFLGGLLVILAIMYFTGLINLDPKKESFTQTGDSAQNSQIQTQATQPEPVPQTTAVLEQEIEQPVAVQQDAVVEQAKQDVAEAVITGEAEVQQAVPDTASEDNAAEIEEIVAAQQQALTEQQAEELAALPQLQQAEVAEAQVPAQPSEPEVQQPVETEQAPAQQTQENDHEQALHQNLRNVAVNVVSYSSDPIQRFVMLDLTIYKEGDSLPNGAEIIEIQRTGAMVEFQNKRYLLKP